MKFFFLVFWAALPASALPLQGGVSGGGGNLIAPKPPIAYVDPETTKQIVYHSVDTLIDYVNAKKISYANGVLPPEQEKAFAPIFTSSKSIEDVIASTRLYVSDEHSCWDSAHQAVDGSTVTPEPDSICISAYNIANKTDASDIPPQAVALMLHEYSELVGLSETQAVQAQLSALQELRENQK